MVIRQIFATVLGLGLVLSVAAQEATLRDGHPDEYVVQQGDTLWDIAGRFLTRPWDWPAIWQANPQIENPHLIYPGDVISLVYIDGEPRLVLNRQGGTDRLSPRIREVDEADAIPTVPLDAVDEYLRYPRILTEEQFEALPYVVASDEGRYYSAPGDNVYVRDLNLPVGSEVVIAQMNYRYRDTEEDKPAKRDFRGSRDDDFYLARRPQHRDPYGWRFIPRAFGAEWPIIGYEMWEIGRGRVVKAGDPAIVLLQEGRREVAAGDYIMPIDEYVYPVYPAAMAEVPANAKVLNVSHRYRAGHFDIVALNIGDNDGVYRGHVFSVFRPGRSIRDNRGMSRSPYDIFSDKVTLPEEYVGRIMVFRTFDRVSYAIMLEGRRSIKENDIVRHADERL